MDEDFAKWYTDICLKADLVAYSSVKGCMIIRPYGYAIWENIQSILDRRFKELGHENVLMPMFIPESLLNKEKEHVEGFAPEVAWVTHGGKREAYRASLRPSDLGNAFLRALCRHHKIMARSSEALQSVVQRRSLGEDHPSLPPHPRIPLAGRSHNARNRRGCA